jgi:excisionase family DNA binding protein
MSSNDSISLFLREYVKPIIEDVVDRKLREHLPPPKPEADDETFITRNDAAKLLGVGLCTLDKLTKLGAVKKYRNGSIVRLKKSEVLAAFQTYEKRKRHQFDKLKAKTPTS